VFAEYIEGQPAVVVSIVPNGKTDLAANEPNYETPEPVSVEEPEQDRPPTVSPRAPDDTPKLRLVEDDFDRSVQPTPGVNPVVQLPPVADLELANGVRLLAVPNEETPTVTIQVTFDAGQRDEPAGKAGVAALTAAMMNESTKQRTAAEFSEALERIGASVGVGSGQYQTSITLNTLSKHLDEAMSLMIERLLEPAFTEEDFKRVHAQTMESLIQSRKSGSALASRASSAVLAGPTHPLSYPSSGLPSTVTEITLDDVKAFYQAHIPQHMKGVLVSTNLPIEETRAALAPLGALEVEPAVRAPVAGLRDMDGRTIYLVNKDQAAQSSVRLIQPAIPYDALGDYYQGNLMNFNLGGTFDSRINLDLREEKGWTYGAYTGFSGGQEFGSYQFSAEINKDATSNAILATLDHLQEFTREGMTEDEFTYLQNAIGQSDALSYETPGKKLGLLNQVLTYDLPTDYRRQQQTLLKETDRETLNALAVKLIDPENMAIIVVGDAASLRPELEALGYPIVELNEEGFAAEES